MTPLNDGGDNTGVLVVVAAHDEADYIGATLAALREAFPQASLWVADDGSRDGTAELAEVGGTSVVRLGRNVGKGQAMTQALRRALVAADRSEAGKGADAADRSDAGDIPDSTGEAVVLLCDGDLGSSGARLGPLVEAVRGGEADLAVAVFARRAGGGFGIAVRFARWAIRTRAGLEAKAPLSGQRALRASRLRELLPFAPGYGMEVGMTIDALRAGMSVLEIELDLEHRASGRTLRGFAHRGRQLFDCARACAVRR